MVNIDNQAVTDAIFQTERWYEGRDQPTTPEETALQIGYQLEAIGRKIELLSPAIGNWMRQYGLMFRGGECDQLLRDAFHRGDRTKMLALDLETVWRTVGAAHAAHTDFYTAYLLYVDVQNARDDEGKLPLPLMLDVTAYVK